MCVRIYIHTYIYIYAHIYTYNKCTSTYTIMDQCGHDSSALEIARSLLQKSPINIGLFCGRDLALQKAYEP